MKQRIILFLGCLLVSVTMMAQHKVTGVVFDDMNETAIGATVVEKGKPANAAVTDMDGNFALTVSKPTSTIVITYIGFEPMEVELKNRTKVTVNLKTNNTNLDEVVVVGFATQKKLNATGSVKTIGDEMMKDRPTVNAVQSLQGAVAGLNITTDGGGAPGSKMNINIRGVGNLGDGSNSSPLVLIDGMEGDLSTLNPNDIENVSVLKDAAAAAVYGSRAPFGVILVTTKSGVGGKTTVPQIQYSGNLRINQPMDVPEMVDGLTFAYMMNDAYINSGGNAPFGAAHIKKIKDYMEGKSTKNCDSYLAGMKLDKWYENQACFGNTDWYDVYIKDQTVSTEHNLAISGGLGKLNYRISGNYMRQTGLFNYADELYQRANIAGKFQYKPHKMITLGYSVRLAMDKNDKPSALDDLFYHNLGRRAPVVPVINSESGEYHSDSMIPAVKDGGRVINKTKKLYNQGSIVIEPIKNWKIHAEANSRLEWNPYDRGFNPLPYHLPSGKIGYMLVNEGVVANHKVNADGTYSVVPDYGETYAEDAETKVHYFNTNVYTDYKFSLNEAHNFTILLGEQSEYWKRETNRSGYYYSKIQDNETKEYTDEGIRHEMKPTNYQEDWASLGFFARLNYDYKYRYLLELNIRADGASRFPTDQRWGYFPSVSAGWNVAEEPLMKNIRDKFLDMLKLRGSYGTLGNQNTSSCYPYYQQMKDVNASVVFGGEQVNKLPVYSPYSTTLTWETIENSGFGVDFAMFGSRLSGSFDWYQRTTKDMVGPAAALTALYGASAPRTNNATLRTRGWELEMKWRDNIGKFNYGIGFSLSDYNSVVTKYYNSTGQCTDANNGTYWYEGKKVGEIWGYQILGIAKSDDEMDQYLAKVDQAALGTKWGGGDFMYADLNGDHKVDGGSYTLDDHGDLKRIGNTTPHYAYSITLDGSYKWFDFRVYFQGIGKRDYVFPNSAPYFGIASEWQRTLYKEHLDYFRFAGSELGSNQDPFYGRIRIDGNNTKISDRFVENAAYCRLKNVQLGFTIPFSEAAKKYIKHCRIYVSGENLLTFTNLRIFDPEAINGAWGPGKSYPNYRTFSVGADIKF